MKKIFILVSLVIFSFKLNTMEQQSEVGLGSLPTELKLHILSFTKADNLTDLFKNLSGISETDKEMYSLAKDKILIKNLITTYINKQLKNKSLEEIVPEIIQANDFLQKHSKKDKVASEKDKDAPEKKLLEVINEVYSPIFKSLAKKYLNIEGKNIEDINSEFLKAISLGESNKVKLFLIDGANPNSIGLSKQPVLIESIAKRKIEIIHALLNAGANPDTEDILKRTALRIAAEKNNKPIVQLLLNAGANPNIQSNKESGYTALMWAAANNNIHMAEALLKAGADPRVGPRGKTALELAQKYGSKKLVNIIKEYLQKKV